MTAPSDLLPVCDGEQVSPGGRIGSGGKHGGGKDRTIHGATDRRHRAAQTLPAIAFVLAAAFRWRS